jgi:uncharacterized lipoprotein
MFTMKLLLVGAASLALLAGCSTGNHQGSGGADVNETQGLSGGVTGTPSGTTQAVQGSDGGVGAAKTASTSDSTSPR